MSNHPTIEEKQHMIDLIDEMKVITNNILKIRMKPMPERIKIANRMKEIKIEMEDYTKRYPDD
jgi:hypothetical protein